MTLDPKTGVRETEWQRLKRSREPQPMNDPNRTFDYRFFYKDKTDLVFPFFDDHQARKHAIDDPFVRMVQLLSTGRVVYRAPGKDDEPVDDSTEAAL